MLKKIRFGYIFDRSEVWGIVFFDIFSEIFKGLQPLFPARIDAKSAKKSKRVVLERCVNYFGNYCDYSCQN